ncbi:hypothetical protein GIB67_028461, partial [Kingdonia uniflora]
TMAVAEVAKTDIVFFNQEEVVGETYQASADQIAVVSVEEQTLEVEKTKDKASQHIYISLSYFDISVPACFNGVRSGCHLKEEAYTN